MTRRSVGECVDGVTRIELTKCRKICSFASMQSLRLYEMVVRFNCCKIGFDTSLDCVSKRRTARWWNRLILSGKSLSGCDVSGDLVVVVVQIGVNSMRGVIGFGTGVRNSGRQLKSWCWIGGSKSLRS